MNTEKKANNNSLRRGRCRWMRVAMRCAALLAGVMAWMMPAMAQHPFTLTTAADITNGTQHYYLIQSIDRPSFYAIPHATGDGDKVSTTSIPNANMRWCFVDAGSDGDHQYYYIVNSTGRCLYRNSDGNDGILIKKTYAELSSLSDAELNKYKFYLTQTGSDYFIQPKGASNLYLNKRGGNVQYANTYYIKASTYNDAPSVWNFVAVGSVTWTQPFTVSTNSEKHYYKFQNVNNTSFYLSNSGEWATVSSAGSDEDIWYFLEAGADATYSNFHYYYIVNASTRKYLYYTGGTGDNVAKVMDYNSAEDDKYRFLIVDAAYKPDNTNYATAYTIVPKLRQTYFYDKDSYAPMAMSDDSHLLLKSDRGSGNYNSHWDIVVTVYSAVEPPTIAFNASHQIEITSHTGETNPDIRYTTNGDEPSSTVGETYTGPFALGDDVTEIKAVEIVGSETSAVTTFTWTVDDPVIAYDAATNQISITCGTAGATIYYTLDGTEPSTSSSTFSSAFVLDPATNTIKAFAKKGGVVSTTVTLLQPVQTTVGVNKRKYLIQSQNNVWSTDAYHFYMIPGDVEEINSTNVTKVNTTSLFRPSMEWYFLNAGVQGGVQCYYIVNESTGSYLYHSTIEGVCLKASGDFDGSDDNFKFCIEASPTVGTFNIIAYSISAGGNRFINKPNGNNKADVINLITSGSSANARWKFILSSTLDKSAPFTGSNPSTGSYSYYKIQNFSGGDYIFPVVDHAHTSSSDDETMNWYFEVAQAADASDWLTYYYIRNAVTGDYLYFSSGDLSAQIGSTITAGDEDHYRFTWARSATDGAYYIIPQYLKDQSQNTFNVMYKQSTTSLRTNSTRGAGTYSWKFEPSSYTCATPTITWSSDDNGYVITSAEPDAKIWYTMGTGELNTSTGTLYESPISVATLGVDEVTIRAIAARNNNGSDASSEASLTVTRVATPAMELTDDGKVRLTCATSGVDFYYEMGATPSVPTISSNHYTGPIEGAAGKYIKVIAVKGGMINSPVFTSEQIKFTCANPIVRKTSATTFTIECSFPSGAYIRYTKGTSPDDPTTESGTEYIGSVSFSESELPFTVKAIAYAAGYNNSAVVTKILTEDLDQAADGYYVIASEEDFGKFIQMANGGGADEKYKITSDITFSTAPATITTPFTGELKGVAKVDGTFPVLSGLTHAIFNTVNGGSVHGVVLKNVTISQSGNVGAICNEAAGDSRIYNCGILPTDANFTTTSNIGSTTTSGTDGYCGSLVGLLDGSSRVINCFSYANITGGNIVGGIVGNNNTSGATQDNYTTKAIVMNCFFYGDIDTAQVGGTPKNAFPVYGGNVIDNEGTTSINNYNYYRDLATFDNSYKTLPRYNRSWPAEERNIRRFEYYRSILNSNRRLCTWWVNGTDNTAPTDADVATVDIAKWVLDRSIAPYPVLKKWGKYPSIINPNPAQVWDTVNNAWVQRTQALPYQGKQLGTLEVKVKTGDHPGTLTGLVTKNKTLSLPITDMDTLNYDYCYGKVQLPYYNEVFGDPSSNNHLTRYYGNYTNKVVTAWKITEVTDDGRTRNAFVPNWEDGYNYADRNCIDKDIYSSNGNRAFAQGGFYYVPEGVTKIEIEAYWGTAFYLHGKGHAVDRVNVCNNKNYGDAFTPAGTLPDKWVYNDITIYDDFATVVGVLSTSVSNVYDQAIVLVGNFPLHAQNDIGLDNDNKQVTLMSADLDMDNEPDFCFPFQWRSNTDRRPILPIRFDFLPIPELGLTMRHNTYAYALGIMVPRGHFEITETAFMHTTQFEYMASTVNNNQKPLILNGGQFEQIVVKGTVNNGVISQVANTRNIIMGGHIWMKRFTPGSHAGDNHRAVTRHCAVSVMGGEFPEFYLSGHYRTDITTANAYDDNPHCYVNGGRFGIMAGAGMEGVKNSVYFEIDHSIIDEFYGGGINANNPVVGSINVTINNSLVLDKYCGGPKVGSCQTVTTNATGTIFNQYFGGGNGGTNLYREKIFDDNQNDMPSSEPSSWPGWNAFKPISTQGADVTYDSTKGYHAEFEFEVFNQSNGINNQAVVRTYRHWAQFGTTVTGNVSNTLTHCTVINNFYAAGNLGNVNGTVTSILDNCTLLKNAFGAGYSATIPHFPVHDKSKVSYPYRDASGVCHNGSVGYRTDPAADTIIQYTWCYENPTTHVVYPLGVVIPAGVSFPDVAGETVAQPAFQDANGKWYCLTKVSLENLGMVSGTATLTLKGNTTVGTFDGSGTLLSGGDVYGGGDESAVGGSTSVILQGSTRVGGNVFGGGNRGTVGGSSSVTIQDPTE